MESKFRTSAPERVGSLLYQSNAVSFVLKVINIRDGVKTTAAIANIQVHQRTIDR